MKAGEQYKQIHTLANRAFEFSVIGDAEQEVAALQEAAALMCDRLYVLLPEEKRTREYTPPGYKLRPENLDLPHDNR
ncbi:MAG TPA: hypothetical protein VEY71_01330 [Chitinophagales bacterium]|nr:hypothetical protein [Chitinophagales bacterium]